MQPITMVRRAENLAFLLKRLISNGAKFLSEQRQKLVLIFYLKPDIFQNTINWLNSCS